MIMSKQYQWFTNIIYHHFLLPRVSIYYPGIRTAQFFTCTASGCHSGKGLSCSPLAEPVTKPASDQLRCQWTPYTSTTKSNQIQWNPMNSYAGPSPYPRATSPGPNFSQRRHEVLRNRLGHSTVNPNWSLQSPSRSRYDQLLGEQNPWPLHGSTLLMFRLWGWSLPLPFWCFLGVPIFGTRCGHCQKEKLVGWKGSGFSWMMMVVLMTVHVPGTALDPDDL